LIGREGERMAEVHERMEMLISQLERGEMSPVTISELKELAQTLKMREKVHLDQIEYNKEDAEESRKELEKFIGVVDEYEDRLCKLDRENDKLKEMVEFYSQKNQEEKDAMQAELEVRIRELNEDYFRMEDEYQSRMQHFDEVQRKLQDLESHLEYKDKQLYDME
jgi:transcriptional regulator with XRE-family HTH domain